MMIMPPKTNTDPVEGDVYRTSPDTSASGDVHGENKRICGVVELTRRSVLTLTRTTRPEKHARKLESAKNKQMGLTKAAWWTDVNQRPLSRSWLADPARVEYLGRLPDPESRQLAEFWQMSKMLGRTNL